MNDNDSLRIVFLRGRKVILRPVEERDIPNMQRWINDQEVIRGTLQFLPVSETGEREWLERIRKDANAVMLAIETHAGRHIGTIGLFGISWRDGTAHTGTLIGEPDCRGKGYGTDAKMALLHYAFHTLNLRKICSSSLEFNAASLHYNLKCGYQEEGRRKQQFFRDGRYWDEIKIAVFREDWLPLWERYLADPSGS
jgi:RimJ/RimL family protein N-acetyltransferase